MAERSPLSLAWASKAECRPGKDVFAPHFDGLSVFPRLIPQAYTARMSIMVSLSNHGAWQKKTCQPEIGKEPYIWEILFVKILNLALIVLTLYLVGCSKSSEQTLATDTQTGSPMVIGVCTPASLKGNPVFNSWYTPEYQSYTPNGDAVAKIASMGDTVQVLVFMGTWCGDSKREVPRFFHIVDAAKIPQGSITMYGVDRTKKTSDGLADKYGITNVPTFIFLSGGKEIGRIVESPKKSLEEDMVEILGSR